MLKIVILACLLIFSSLLFPGNTRFWKGDGQPLQITKEKRYRVTRVFDGDTIQVVEGKNRVTIRMAGIDAPEIGFDGRPGQPYSRQAKHYLAKRVENKTVNVKGYGVGGYGRRLAEIFLIGSNLNLEMISAGFAEVYSGKLPKNLDSKAYYDAQAAARKNQKGMWRQGRSYKSPRWWRKKYPRK